MLSADATHTSSRPASRSSSVYGGGDVATKPTDLWTGNPFPLSDPQHHEVKKANRAAVVKRMPPLQTNLRYRLSDVILEEAHQHQLDVISTAANGTPSGGGDRSLSPKLLPPAPQSPSAAQLYTETSVEIPDATAGAVLHGGTCVWVGRRNGFIDVVDSLSSTVTYSICVADQLLIGVEADRLAAREKATEEEREEARKVQNSQGEQVVYPCRISCITPRYALVALTDGRAQVYDTISLQAICQANCLPSAPSFVSLLSRDDCQRTAYVILACNSSSNADEDSVGATLSVVRFLIPDKSDDDGVLGSDDVSSSLQLVLTKTLKNIRVTCLFATSDVSTLIVGDRGGCLCRVDLNDLTIVSNIQLFPKKSSKKSSGTESSNDYVTAVALSENDLLLCGCSDGSVWLFSFGVSTSWTVVKLHKKEHLHGTSPVTSLAIEHSTKRCWSAALDGSIAQWSLSSTRGFEVLPASRARPLASAPGGTLIDFLPSCHADSMRLVTISSAGINHFWATQFVVSEAEAEAAVHEADCELEAQVADKARWVQRVQSQRQRNEQRLKESVKALSQFSTLRSLRAAYWKLDKYRLMRRLYHKREAAVALLLKAEETTARTISFWRLRNFRDARRAEKERQRCVQTIELCLARRLQRRSFIVWEEYVRRKLQHRKRSAVAGSLLGNVEASSRRLWLHKWQLNVEARAFRKKQSSMAAALHIKRSNQLLLAYYARWRDERRRREAFEQRSQLINEMSSQSGFHVGSRSFKSWRQWSFERRALRDKRRWTQTVSSQFDMFAMHTAFSTWIDRTRQRIIAEATARVDAEKLKMKAAEERHQFIHPRVQKQKQLEELKKQLAAAKTSLEASKKEQEAAALRVESLKGLAHVSSSSPSSSQSGALVADIGQQHVLATQMLRFMKQRCLNLYAEMPFIEKTVERNKRAPREAARNAYLVVQKVVLDTLAGGGKSNYSPPSPWPVGDCEVEIRSFISRIPVESHAPVVNAIKTIAILADFLSPGDLSAISFDSDLAVNGELMLSLFDALNAGVMKRKLSLSVLK